MVISVGQVSEVETGPSKSVCYRGSATSRIEAVVDAELVRRFNAGDESAFITIMGRYRGLLLSLAFGVLRNHGDAEEIAQDTFVCAHRGLSNFRGDSSLATWLHRITLNLSRNRYWHFYRRRRHASVSLNCTLGEDSTMTFSDLVTTDAVGPLRDVMIGEFSDLVSHCMSRLSESQREILTMAQRQSYAEIAQHFGINIGTVKSRIARARERLRCLMGDVCPEFNSAERRVEWFDPVRHTGGIEIVTA